jgi:hypothetical protein
VPHAFCELPIEHCTKADSAYGKDLRGVQEHLHELGTTIIRSEPEPAKRFEHNSRIVQFKPKSACARRKTAEYQFEALCRYAAAEARSSNQERLSRLWQSEAVATEPPRHEVGSLARLLVTWRLIPGPTRTGGQGYQTSKRTWWQATNRSLYLKRKHGQAPGTG